MAEPFKNTFHEAMIRPKDGSYPIIRVLNFHGLSALFMALIACLTRVYFNLTLIRYMSEAPPPPSLQLGCRRYPADRKTLPPYPIQQVHTCTPEYTHLLYSTNLNQYSISLDADFYPDFFSPFGVCDPKLLSVRFYMLITTCYLFPKKNTKTKNAEWLILQKIKRPQMQVLSMDVDHLGNSAASGSYHRILIDGHAYMYVQHTRYIHISPNVYDQDIIRFTPLILNQLPPLPSPLNWNITYTTKSPAGGIGASSRWEESHKVTGLHPKPVDILFT